MKINQNRLLIVIYFLVIVNVVFSEEPKIDVGTFKEIQIKSEDLTVTGNAIVVSDSAILVKETTVTTGQTIEMSTETAIKVEKKEEEKIEKYNLENYIAVEGSEQKGKATYYSKKFHGRKTTSNEKFSIYKYTGAHRTLKFGTLVKVTNVDNGKSVIVRINDRGPFTKGKIIDLSPVAFEELANLNKGILNVKIEIVKENSTKIKDEEKKQPEEETKKQE